ncbi:MAG: sigma 54-interacting transcriptional regulator [Gammaproteobacteria bacterium]|jgi:two-component system response regulator GlrR|nr:sigma 54-interacting transcriptional regulator [Zhongshania sp.]MBU0537364.1 sigma 54-interacting transcriptional regulator [Gammaproteobacteria bacterium]MBU1831946.1 sigma 54-interacting transcriptional regulator [Gammaproteobacteria bacterium]
MNTPRRIKILLVDDDPGVLQLLSMRLEALNFDVVCADGGDSALATLQMECAHIVISDLRMDGMDGIELFEKIQQLYPGLPVIVLTAHGSIKEAVSATQKGVFSFLTKPVDKDELLSSITQALNLHSPETQSNTNTSNIITCSANMQQLLEQAKLLAQSDINIMIRGESGTGKELLASALQASSPRAGQAYVAINCSAIPAELLESELFGHVKGAFTGATRDNKGLFASADGGTVFLDEIGDMPAPLQVKLLRVLQEQKIRPVGSHQDISINVRVLSATHQNVEEAISDGRFREDLYYRLNVASLSLPALRERRADIQLLAKHFLENIAQRSNNDAKKFSPAALVALMSYDWPGNIRQLNNIVEQLAALSPAAIIGETQVLSALPQSNIVTKEIPSLAEARKQFEREYLEQVLVQTQGNVTDAARQAGRNRSDFHKLIKKHQLNPDILRNAKRQSNE